MLINCGGTIDIIEVLEPDEDITFFVVDSHRPIDICNIYSSSQVLNIFCMKYVIVILQNYFISDKSTHTT